MFWACCFQTLWDVYFYCLVIAMNVQSYFTAVGNSIPTMYISWWHLLEEVFKSSKFSIGSIVVKSLCRFKIRLKNVEKYFWLNYSCPKKPTSVALLLVSSNTIGWNHFRNKIFTFLYKHQITRYDQFPLFHKGPYFNYVSM